MPSPLTASPFTFGKQPPNGYYCCTAYFGIEVTCFFTLISILWNGSTALGIPCPKVFSSLSQQVTKSGSSKNSVRINHEAALEELTVSVLKKLDSISDDEFESFTAAKQKSRFTNIRTPILFSVKFGFFRRSSRRSGSRYPRPELSCRSRPFRLHGLRSSRSGRSEEERRACPGPRIV